MLKCKNMHKHFGHNNFANYLSIYIEINRQIILSSLFAVLFKIKKKRELSFLISLSILFGTKSNFLKVH